jgi:hypothetical protein
MGFLDLDARRHKACFFQLTVYFFMKGVAVVDVLYSFKIDIDFQLCFGVNDGIEHAGTQCSYCVSLHGVKISATSVEKL